MARRFLYNPANNNLHAFEDNSDGTPAAGYLVLRQDRPDLIDLPAERGEAILRGETEPKVAATPPLRGTGSIRNAKGDKAAKREPLFDASKVDQAVLDGLAPVFEQIDNGDEAALRAIALSFEFTLPPPDQFNIDDLRDLCKAGAVKAYG